MITIVTRDVRRVKNLFHISSDELNLLFVPLQQTQRRLRVGHPIRLIGEETVSG